MKKILLFVIIIGLLIPVLTVAENDYDDKQILINILNDLGGNLEEFDTAINGILFKRFLNEEELNIEMENIKSEIGILEETRDEIYGDGHSQINLYSQDKYNNPITIILSSYIDDDSKIKETYLYLNFINKEHFLENNDIIDRVENIFNKKGSVMEITTSLIGVVDGNGFNNGIESKAIKTIKKLKGEFVEEFTDINLLSYTAYTPYIVKNIAINRKKINLNLAIRYNDYEDKTYIWIGTPIITSGY